MKNLILYLLILLTTVLEGKAQSHFTISGFVEDINTHERLSNATLFEKISGKGVICNNYGFYSFTLPKGNYVLQANHVGYAPAFLSVQLTSDTIIHIRLASSGLLDEVIVSGTSPFVRSAQTGKHILSLDQIKAMPSILGESDVLKALQNLPGVNSGAEGMSRFSVRGGSPEQTQILLDGVPVYNVNHCFGYFSAFNGEALKELTLYKSGIPARYGGRLSSVLDITMKEGNSQNFSGDFSLSPIAGTLTLQGPVKKDKISYLISGRYTWANALFYLGQKLTQAEQIVGYGFYDLNAKINWKINPANHVFLSFYSSNDRYYVQFPNQGQKDKSQQDWTNLSLSARWYHIINPHLFLNTQIYYSSFRNIQKNRNYSSQDKRNYHTEAYSELEEISGKGNFEYIPTDKHHLRFGFAISRKHFAPQVSFRELSPEIPAASAHENSGQLELYIENDWEISQHWQMNTGLRSSGLFTSKQQYYSLEPRFALTFLLNINSSIKLSYSAMQQNLHMLSHTTLFGSTDLWVPVTDKVKPGYSNLFSLGVYHNFKKKLEFSTEIYYNTLHRMIRYKEGISYLKQKDRSWEEYLYRGQGRAYGIDLMLNKSSGRLNGWISYSLSRSERSYKEIQNGAWFPSEYDRTHKINLVTNYTFKDKESYRFQKIIALNFTYASGSYITLGKQIYSSNLMPGRPSEDIKTWVEKEYIKHPNNCRLPAYHHLDLAFHLRTKKQRGDSWSFCIYNIYFRKNPSFYYRHEHNGKAEIRQISILPFMPSVTWTYKF